VNESADAIIVGAGVQGASLAFHLAERGLRVLVLEKGTIACGATGVSSGFVRMHYDLESESRLAWASFPYFTDWSERVGAGDCSYVRTGFVYMVPPDRADALRANVAIHQRIGIPSQVIGPADLAELIPGIVTDDVVVAAYEPASGYADPSGTTSGFLTAARNRGARLIQGCRVTSVTVQGDRVAGVETDRGSFAAPLVVDAAGAWAAELARTVGLDVPVEAWRHETAFFGLPPGRSADTPIVMDPMIEVYFRPEGREFMLVGLEGGNEVGGSPDRPLQPIREATVDAMVTRICQRLPWMANGTFRNEFGGQDGMTPDGRPIIDQAGPSGFYLLCGMSAHHFKTAPAIGASLAELMLDGQSRTVDISDYRLSRFAEGRLLVSKHPYRWEWH
jgi:sarcosine oxidase subunit beta